MAVKVVHGSLMVIAFSPSNQARYTGRQGSGRVKADRGVNSLKHQKSLPVIYSALLTTAPNASERVDDSMLRDVLESIIP